MKGIIVLTFFGILGCTFCNHVRTGPVGCRDVYDQAASDLNNEQFFSGSWYLTYGKYKNYTSLCTKFDMTWTPLQITYDFNNVKITCKGEKLQGGARHTEYNCKAPEGTQHPGYESVLAVIDTDYNKYATVYTCLKSSDHGDNVFVLSRTRTDEPPEAAKQSLQKLGENFEDFQKFTCIELQTYTVS